MPNTPCLASRNRREAKRCWGASIHAGLYQALDTYSRDFRFSISAGDLLLLAGKWYVTHSGLVRLAHRLGYNGVYAEPVLELCNPDASRFCFRAIVYRSASCRGFSGYGDADPSNVSPFVHGAEFRMAETRAVNRALRKAYGIGICSVEEVGTFERQPAPEHPVRKLPPESTEGNSRDGHHPNGDGRRVRDRLCQLIRQHNLDAELVKAYAVDFCGTKTLREATREQVENFVAHLADWAEKDRDALLCQLNSYSRTEAGAA